MMFWYWRIIINAIEMYNNHGFKAALYSHFLIMYCFIYLIFLLIVIIMTAVSTLYERKILADIQSRRGPSKPGFLGILQPIADAFKLILKEYIIPRKHFDKVFPFIAVLSFIIAAFFWNLPTLSFENSTFYSEWTFLVTFLISVGHVFTILFAGWSSNSRYSFLGALRTSAQLIAYDIVIVLVYLNIFFYSKEASFESVVEVQKKIGSFFLFLPFQLLVFFIASLAETNRHPYDLPEAESELVAGYNVEYSSIRFAMFFLAEYSSAMFSALLINTLFFAGLFGTSHFLHFVWWSINILVIFYVIVKVRGLVPRYRYDQLMDIGWKVLIPFECATLLFGIFIKSIV